MEQVAFGNTGIMVSRLCFGTGQMGDIRFSLSDKQGGDLLKKAFDMGVTFWDTAQSYGSYRHVREGLKGIDREKVVINTKTGHPDSKRAYQAVEEALREMKTDYIDTICLHAVPSREEFDHRQAALEALLVAKEEGLVRAVGLTSHIYTGEIMETAIEHPDIELIIAFGNKTGLGLLGGSMDEQAGWLKKAADSGMGVAIFKVIAEGKKAGDSEEWIKAAMELEGVHSFDIGMINEAQIEMNCRIIEGQSISEELRAKALNYDIPEWVYNYPKEYHEEADIEAAGKHVHPSE